MSYHYSQRSLDNLKTCHSDLQLIFSKVIKIADNSIVEGYRNEEDQEKYFKEGKSQVHYPHGKHNHMPSMAVHAIIYPIDWKDTKRFFWFAGLVIGIAQRLLAEGKITHTIRWGGDWDRDNDFSDQTLNDYIHFELVKE
ncbi:MAG: M15 family peptidase [Candidatus Thorarchaeota archaeon]